MKYNLRCQYCGTNYFVNRLWLYLKLLFFGEVRHQCSNCMRQSRYIMVSHIVHDNDNKEKVFNRAIDEHKRKYW